MSYSSGEAFGFSRERIFTARTNDLHTARILLGLGLDVNQIDRNGCTPFLEAARTKHINMAYLFAEQGADVTVKNNQGFSAVNYAIELEKLQFLQFLIEKGAFLDAPDKYSFTPLMNAIINDNYQMVKNLVAGGANLNARTTKNVNLTIWGHSHSSHLIPTNTTPLGFAQILKRTHMVELLGPKN